MSRLLIDNQCVLLRFTKYAKLHSRVSNIARNNK